MFENMRRKEKQMSDKDTVAVMNKGNYGVLSTVDENGYPYGVPVNYVYEDGKIYFHCAKEGHKLRNIVKNNKVSFCVVTNSELLEEAFTTRFTSAISFGTISEVINEKERYNVYKLIIERLCGHYITQGMDYVKSDGAKAKVFAIKVEHMSGKQTK